MTLVPTPEQQQVIDYPLRPLRVTAGAGTGKTTTMALRLAALIRREGLEPEEALGITFTNKAAEELADRLREHLSDLAETGRQSIQRAHYLAGELARIPGVRLGVGAPFAREFPILLPADPQAVILAMAERGFLAGIALPTDYPELPNGLLVAVTERRTRAELDGYAAALSEVLAHG